MKYLRRNKSDFYMLLAYAVIVLGSFFVWERVQQKLLSQKINAIREKTAKVTAENQRISMKIAEITSPGNMEEISKKRFGFVKITHIEVLPDGLKK